MEAGEATSLALIQPRFQPINVTRPLRAVIGPGNVKESMDGVATGTGVLASTSLSIPVGTD